MRTKVPKPMRGMPVVNRTVVAPGQHITEPQREKILKMLKSGQFPVKAEIARACMCSVGTINRILADNPEIEEAWHEAVEEQIGMVERSMFDLAQNAHFEPAREKAAEFILTHHKPEVYSETAQLLGAAKTAKKRVVMVAKLEEVAVDDNGIPIAKSESPLKQELIDVR